MKPKWGRCYNWSNSEKAVWFLYGSIPLLLVFYLISIVGPQRFEVNPEIIPTIEYVQVLPQEGRVRLVVEQVAEYYNYPLYNVCLQNVSIQINEPQDNQAWELVIDGYQVDMLSAERNVDGFWTCTSRIYLAKGLHLVKFQNQNLDVFLEWAIEVE